MIEADLAFIPLDLVEILKTPSAAEVERLVERYGAASPKARRDLLVLLAVDPTDLGEVGWSWIEEWLSEGPTDDARGQAFQTLDRADPVRFGQRLLASGWTWSSGEHVWVNHHGSHAMMTAVAGIPFEQIVSRMAPWRLLEAARRRGEDPDEVRLAAEVFGAVLGVEMPHAPDLGADVEVDLERSDGALAMLSIAAREEVADGIEGLRRQLDSEARLKARRLAAETAMERLRAARRAGADLFLMNMTAADFVPVLWHAPDVAQRWVEGLSPANDAAANRVRRAEGAFLALCEAYLNFDPHAGARIWRALGEMLSTRFVGTAGIDERLHMIFRARSSPAIDRLRSEAFELPSCNSDQKLFELAVAASLGGQGAWLEARLAEDRASGSPWRVRRSLRVTGFTLPPADAIAAPWPAGESSSSFEGAQRDADLSRNRTIWARRWWLRYVAAATPEDALAAWTMIEATADARAWAWLRGSLETPASEGGFAAKKAAHAQLNLPDLKRAMEKRGKVGEDKLFGRSIVDGVWPWEAAPDGLGN